MRSFILHVSLSHLLKPLSIILPWIVDSKYTSTFFSAKSLEILVSFSQRTTIVCNHGIRLSS